jgi:hypothetical protein
MHLPPSTQHDLVSLSIHDGFQGTTSRAGFLGSDRVILDTHPYFAFDGAPNDSLIAPSTDPLELQLVGTFVEYEVLQRAASFLYGESGLFFALGSGDSRRARSETVAALCVLPGAAMIKAHVSEFISQLQSATKDIVTNILLF